MRVISSTTVDHPDETLEKYKPPYPFPDEAVMIDGGREFIDSKISLKVKLCSNKLISLLKINRSPHENLKLKKYFVF